MYDSTYAQYLKDIANTQLLSKEEEQLLFSMYAENKSKAIKDKLMSSNLRFVLKTALTYKSSNVNMSDLISEGTLGLSKAIDNYDVTRGQKFITYAVYWIKSYINTAIANHKNMIHIPANRVIQCSKAVAKNAKGAEMDREAAAIMAINNAKVSIDSSVGDNSKNTFADIITDHKDDIKIENNEDISALVEGLTACLPEKEKHVLCETYGVNSDKAHTLREIGSSIGYSHARIRQLRDQALRRIKKYTSKEMLEAAKDIVYDANNK